MDAVHVSSARPATLYTQAKPSPAHKLQYAHHNEITINPAKNTITKPPRLLLWAAQNHRHLQSSSETRVSLSLLHDATIVDPPPSFLSQGRQPQSAAIFAEPHHIIQDGSPATQSQQSSPPASPSTHDAASQSEPTLGPALRRSITLHTPNQQLLQSTIAITQAPTSFFAAVPHPLRCRDEPPALLPSLL
ncbi:hypothetical protein M0R45_027496 [Rubus argutus]|uniref:Uncharacterized protein n=1 Tax=Rubus argutus TaxID=59490 RepID=A0AAW1X179_RUBAR